MKSIVFLSVCLVFCFHISCSNDHTENNKCISTGVGYVTAVKSPFEGNINKKVDITLKFPVYNGCGRFLETRAENSRIVAVEATYQGCLYTTDIPITTVNSKFITDKAGHYELSFKSGETEFIIVNPNIN